MTLKGMTGKRFLWLLPAVLTLLGCSQGNEANLAEENTPPGTLIVTANGEDFVRQGFTTKDGWQIDFNNVYVTFNDIEVFQAEPPFEPEKQDRPKAETTVSLATGAPITVDLADGDENAEPIVVATLADSPGGRYNALGWRMVAAPDGPAAGYPLMLVGSATKGNESINFQIQMEESLAFICGDFIGDTRKGILNGAEAEVEATFHFDHLFGDGDAPAEDEINTGALGFEPIAALAEGGDVSLTSSDLQQDLSKEDYKTLQALLPSLGHVGEGHCRETQLN